MTCAQRSAAVMASAVVTVPCILSLMEIASPIQPPLVGTDYLELATSQDAPIVDAVVKTVVLQEQYSITLHAIASQKW